MTPEQHVAASRQRVQVFTLRRGAWTSQGYGGGLILVCSGLMVRQLRLTARISSELIGPGDVLEAGSPDDGLLAVDLRWRVVDEARIAIVGDDVPAAVALNLAHRGALRASRLAVAQAISHLPRIEDRLLGFFTELAGRWGRVTPQGVVVPLGLTHETLGSLV